MRIVMISWEYPPRNIGGLCNHVYNLCKGLKSLGHEVHVITCEEGTAPVEEDDNGVIVHRVTPYRIETEDFIKWVMQLNFAMIEECVRLIRKLGSIDIIHAHDWLSTYVAKAIKWSFNIPMVATIHATESGRNNGIRTDMQRYISSTEWLLCYEASKIVACSDYMKSQIVSTFNVSEEKICVIPNGVNTGQYDYKDDLSFFRRQYASDDEKIIFFIGRHVFEKGIQLLIDAAPDIVAKYSKVKFILAGEGPMTEELKRKVKNIGYEKRIVFPGYMDNYNKNRLYMVANVAVFPSLYEPFGIVALEAMAAGCPVVVSDTGGMGELVHHKYSGMKMVSGQAKSLGDNVIELLMDDKLASCVKKNAMELVREKYTWIEVARATAKMYQETERQIPDSRYQIPEKQFTGDK